MWYYGLDPGTLATWCKEAAQWKRPWSWERLRAGGERDNRGWDGWMASLIQQTWVWASSGRWWRTGTPGVLQSLGLQRVGHDQATEQQQQQKMDMSGETGDNQVELGVQLMVFNTNIKFLILTNVLIRNTWLKDTWKCSVLGFKLLC